MTWQSVICFSVLAPFGILVSAPVLAATVSGSVQLRDSRDATVRKRSDYSGVVVSLTPLAAEAVPSRDRQGAVAGESKRNGSRKVVMLQKNKTFSPHVVAISMGDSVEFPNDDPIFHSAFSNYNGQIFDVGLYAPGTTRVVRFTRPGVVRVFCNIHSTMSAVIVVSAAPYFAVTGRDGAYRIPNVAPGTYSLEVFHERAADATLRNITRKITVEHGDVALPRIEISEAGYLPIPHKNKFGHDYPPEPEDRRVYPAARE